MNQEDIELLKRVSLHLSWGAVTTLLYVPPSKRLRDEADMMDQKEIDTKKLDELIKRLEHGK